MHEVLGVLAVQRRGVAHELVSQLVAELHERSTYPIVGRGVLQPPPEHDNASQDATGARVRSFAEHTDVPVRLVPEPRLGVARARNRGAQAARGLLLTLQLPAQRPAPW